MLQQRVTAEVASRTVSGPSEWNSEVKRIFGPASPAWQGGLREKFAARMRPESKRAAPDGGSLDFVSHPQITG